MTAKSVLAALYHYVVVLAVRPGEQLGLCPARKAVQVGDHTHLKCAHAVRAAHIAHEEQAAAAGGRS